MNYKNIFIGNFIDRPNRFIANVEINGNIERVHVKNTGRCKEILLPGSQVFLTKSDNVDRKTQFDLIAVSKERKKNDNLIINIDSQAPNDVVSEWLLTNVGRNFIKNIARENKEKNNNGKNNANNIHKTQLVEIISVRREVTFGKSRLDFAIDLNIDGEQKILYIEVKGVTLEKNGIAYFPDAPTERGIKHILELEKIAKTGNLACVLFVIQMKGTSEFRPNDETHMEFGMSLRSASINNVQIKAVDCVVSPDSLHIDEAVKVVL